VDFWVAEIKIDPHASQNAEPRVFPMMAAVRSLLETAR